jgi:pimeloyl-ACP methyl ester carboxylesterase
MTDEGRDRTPLDMLGRLSTHEEPIAPGVRLIETYTMRGMLKLLWFGDPSAQDVVLLGGGGMGGFLGPAHGLYAKLGRELARSGAGAICVDYRKPGDLDRSLLDVAATADWAMRTGARRFVCVGHSFGGAVAIQAATALRGFCVGVATLATQSAGCEVAGLLEGIPLLLVHGERDEVLSPSDSATVRSIAGHGELRLYPGAGHNLDEAHTEVRKLLLDWIPARFAEADPARAGGERPLG